MFDTKNLGIETFKQRECGRPYYIQRLRGFQSSLLSSRCLVFNNSNVVLQMVGLAQSAFSNEKNTFTALQKLFRSLATFQSSILTSMLYYLNTVKSFFYSLMGGIRTVNLRSPVDSSQMAGEEHFPFGLTWCKSNVYWFNVYFNFFLLKNTLLCATVHALEYVFVAPNTSCCFVRHAIIYRTLFRCT